MFGLSEFYKQVFILDDESVPFAYVHIDSCFWSSFWGATADQPEIVT